MSPTYPTFTQNMHSTRETPFIFVPLIDVYWPEEGSTAAAKEPSLSSCSHGNSFPNVLEVRKGHFITEAVRTATFLQARLHQLAALCAHVSYLSCALWIHHPCIIGVMSLRKKCYNLSKKTVFHHYANCSWMNILISFFEMPLLSISNPAV